MRLLKDFLRLLLSCVLLFYFTAVTLGLEFLHTHHVSASVCRDSGGRVHCLHKVHVSTHDSCQVCAVHFLAEHISPAVLNAASALCPGGAVPAIIPGGNLAGYLSDSPYRGPPANSCDSSVVEPG